MKKKKYNTYFVKIVLTFRLFDLQFFPSLKVHSYFIFLSHGIEALIVLKCLLQEHLRRILRGQTSLFDWSRSTSLARTLSPRVLESQVDAKKVSILPSDEFIYSPH